MIKASLFDRLSFDVANMKETKDGYLAAAPRVARTGIQLYRGSEIGGELADKDVVRVYRPEEEVFHVDAMQSLSHRPLTNDHPKEEVTAENWKEISVGHTGGDVMRDKEFARVPMLFMDKKAVKDIRGGKKQLSVGYSCDIEVIEGTAPDGQTYDAIQRNIRANHIALVKAARGGARLSVGDEMAIVEETEVNKGEEKVMSLRTLTIDGISVEMTDTAVQVVQKALADANGKIDQLSKDAKLIKDTADKQVADLTTQVTTLSKDKDNLTAENATLKKQVEEATLKPEQIDALVSDRQMAIGKAQAILGDKLVAEKKSIADIKRQVVDAKMGDLSKGWSDEQIATSFLTLTADMKPANGTAVADARNAFSGTRPAVTPNDKREEAYTKAAQRLQDAYKHPNGVPAATH